MTINTEGGHSAARLPRQGSTAPAAAGAASADAAAQPAAGAMTAPHTVSIRLIVSAKVKITSNTAVSASAAASIPGSGTDSGPSATSAPTPGQPPSQAAQTPRGEAAGPPVRRALTISWSGLDGMEMRSGPLAAALEQDPSRCTGRPAGGGGLRHGARNAASEMLHQPPTLRTPAAIHCDRPTRSGAWQERFVWEPPPQLLAVSELHIRALAGAGGRIPLKLSLGDAAEAQPGQAPGPVAPGGAGRRSAPQSAAAASAPAGGAGKAGGAATAVAPQQPAGWLQAVAWLDASGLLVGDTTCALCWKGTRPACANKPAACCSTSGSCSASSESDSGGRGGGGGGACTSPKPSDDLLEGALAGELRELVVSLDISRPPPAPQAPPEPPAGGKPAGAKAAPPATKAGAAADAIGTGGATPAGAPPGLAAAATATVSSAPHQLWPSASPEPCPLLPLALAALLNPIVIRVTKAKQLPDAPATSQQLDGRCGPIALRVRWPPSAAAFEQPAAAVGPWARAAAGSRTDGGGVGGASSCRSGGGCLSGATELIGGPSLFVRSAAFGRPLVLLGGEAGGAAGLRQLLREFPVEFEVHDRAALPEPPEFPLPAREEGAPGSAQQVGQGQGRDMHCGSFQ
jgi:hypothetical protein